MTGSAPLDGRFTKLGSLAKKRKTLVIALGLLAAVLVILFLWNRSSSKSVTYLSENVTTGDVQNIIPASGTLDSENTVPLTFKNSAVIKAIYVKEGQKVKKGDLLAEQDDRDLLTQYEQQLASLKSAEAKLSLARAGARPEDLRQSEESVNIARITYDQSKTTYERYKSLFEQGAVSRSDMEKYENDFKLSEAKLNQAREQYNVQKAGSRAEDILVAESQVDMARAQLQAAKNNIDSAKLLATDDGYIGQVGAVVGQRTSGAGNSSDAADGFVTLISDRLRIRAQVNEADVGRAAVGQKAFFTVNSYPDRKFPGVVESISPKAITVSNVQLYEVIIALEKQDQALKVGMPANVSIIADQRAGVALAPKIAVAFAAKNAASFTASEQKDRASGDAGAPGGAATTGDGSAVRKGPRSQGSGTGGDSKAESGKEVPILVMDKGKPALRQIRIGISDNTNYEVISGLKEGDKVVIGSTAATQPAGTTRPGAGNQMPLGNAARGIMR